MRLYIQKTCLYLQRLNMDIMQNMEHKTPLANNHISVDCVVIGFDDAPYPKGIERACCPHLVFILPRWLSGFGQNPLSAHSSEWRRATHYTPSSPILVS